MHLLICEKGDSICFSTDWAHNAQPPLGDKQGKETFEERRDKTNRGFAVPKPLVPAILYPQWNLDIRGRDTTTTTTPHLSESRPNFVTSCTVHYTCDVGADLLVCFIAQDII